MYASDENRRGQFGEHIISEEEDCTFVSYSYTHLLHPGGRFPNVGGLQSLGQPRLANKRLVGLLFIMNGYSMRERSLHCRGVLDPLTLRYTLRSNKYIGTCVAYVEQDLGVVTCGMTLTSYQDSTQISTMVGISVPLVNHALDGRTCPIVVRRSLREKCCTRYWLSQLNRSRLRPLIVNCSFES